MRNNQFDNWIEYWNQDKIFVRSRLGKINAKIFLRRANKIIKFKKSDIILNIGCGSGYLEMLLAPKVDKIYAVDTAPKLVELCKKNCKNHKNVIIKILSRNITDISRLKEKFFVILCVSVVQYFKDMNEIENLIHSARKIAKPGGKLLIADFPLRRNMFGFIWDSFCSVALSLFRGYPHHLLKAAFARWLQKSEYKSTVDNLDQLHFSIEDIRQLVENMNLNVKVIKKSMSIYANRPSVLIHF